MVLNSLQNIATKDRMETTAGSWMLIGSIVPRDAHVVSLLRSAGALLMGHATLSEWADMRSNNYSEGYSPRGDQARSPYNLTVNPGGSSSGSAGAVAANQVMFSLGTETDGIVLPVFHSSDSFSLVQDRSSIPQNGMLLSASNLPWV